MWTDPTGSEAVYQTAEGRSPDGPLSSVWESSTLEVRAAVGPVARRLTTAQSPVEALAAAAAGFSSATGVDADQIVAKMVSPVAVQLLPPDLGEEYLTLLDRGMRAGDLSDADAGQLSQEMQEFIDKVVHFSNGGGGGGLLGALIGGLVTSVIGLPAIAGTLIGIGVALVADEIVRSAEE